MVSTDDLNIVPPVASPSGPVVISPTVRAAREYRLVETAQDIEGLGFSPKQRQSLPGLLIPTYGVSGQVVTHQLRPETPRVENGIPIEYEMPPKTGIILDVPRLSRSDVLDGTRPLVVTGGTIEADVAVSHGVCAVGLLGLRPRLSRVAEHVWQGIPLAGRAVFLAFPSDFEQRAPGVTYTIKESLAKRGAVVQVLQLPTGPLGARIGVDTFLANGGTVAQLFTLIGEAPPPPAKVPVTYSYTADGIIWHRVNDNLILANFTAKIVRESMLDDGINTARVYDIEAHIGPRKILAQVPAEQFNAMAWPAKHLGARAIIAPVHNASQHLRVAIQWASGEVPCHRIYRHTGWAQTEEYGWVYLHAGGAIGAQGVVPKIEVQLDEGLSAYELPSPPSLDIVRERVRASLDITRAIAGRVSYPLLASTYRAVLDRVDASVFMSGLTGTGKTESAALAQQHFGPRMDARNLPCSWSSTPNSLELSAFLAKDALLVIDDFVMIDPQQAVRLNQVADRVLRAQGNRSGRQRLGMDMALQPPRPPRGLILSTGEDIPRGQSLSARFLHVPVERGDVQLEKLSDCQARAARGEYAEAMSGFLMWLASRKDALDIPGRKGELRRGILVSHPRSADTAANIAVGLQVWLEFAVDIGALTPHEADDLWRHGWHIIRQVAAAQKSLQEGQEPAHRFLELLRAAISGGFAYVTGPDGGPPPNPHIWGWRQMVYHASATPLFPRGTHIGWVEGQALYLEPENAYKVAQQTGPAGAPLVVTLLTLKRRLYEDNWLVESERDRSVYTVRRLLQGVRRDVLYLDVASVLGDIPQMVIPPAGHAQNPTIPTNPDVVGLVGSGEGGEQNISDHPANGDSNGLSLPPHEDDPDDA